MLAKRFIVIIAVVSMSWPVLAQYRQTNALDKHKSIIPIDKQKLLKNVDFIANTQFALRNDFRDGVYQGSKFRLEQFRLEMRGWITDRVYFRFRHRYTSPFEPQTIDKIVKGVDMAYLAFKLDKQEKWEMIVGKFCVDWGGIEFDLNPIDIYEYSDIIEQADNFLTGAGIKYLYKGNNYIGLQVYDSRTQSFDELYGNDSIVGGAGIVASKAPLGVVATWRAQLFDGLINTLWSYSITNEAEGIFKNYLALGNQLNLQRFTLAYDFKISHEDLDRTGIISKEIPRGDYGYVLRNTLYSSHWLQLDWEFTPKWHLAFVGFVDFAKWLDNSEDPQKNTNDIRTGFGYIPTIEYYPWEDLHLKFFLGWVGRVYRYSDYAKNTVNAQDYNTGRFMVGFISPIKFF